MIKYRRTKGLNPHGFRSLFNRMIHFFIDSFPYVRSMNTGGTGYEIR